MSETTQMQPVSITLSAEEFVDVRRFVGGMAHDVMKPMCDFLDRKQAEAQRAAQKPAAEPAPAADKPKKK